MAVAFFDLDRTLISVNSARLWVHTQWKNGQLKNWEMIKLSYAFLQYYFGFSNIENEINKAILSFKGKSEKEIFLQIATFYEQQIKLLYRPGAIKAIEAHRNRNEKVVLLTSSPYFIAQLVTKDLRLDDCLCTRFEVDEQGIYTGNSVGPICYGAGKSIVAQNYIDQLKIPFTTCTFYSDSITDLPTFKKVGMPVVVNPDPRLHRVAHKLNWPVVDWGNSSDS